MNYKRRISDNEYMYLAAGNAFSDLIIKTHIVGRGSLSQYQLQKAVNTVSAEFFPGANLSKKGSFWKCSASTPPVRYLESLPENKSLFYDFINQPYGLSPYSGPTCDILMHRDGQETHLIFRSLHAVMDGIGLDLWVKAVFTALRGDICKPCLSQLNEDELLTLSDFKVRDHHVFRPTFIGLDKSDHDLPEPEFASTTLYGHSSSILAQLCLGLTKILCTGGKDKCLFMIPCDLRNSINPVHANSSANLTLPMFIEADTHSKEEALIADMLSQMNEKTFFSKGRWDVLSRYLPETIFARGMKSLWEYMSKKNQYLVSATLSHIGRKKLADYSCRHFKAEKHTSIPCTIPICPISLIVNESERCTEICLVVSKRSKKTAKDILSDIIKESKLSYLRPDCSQISSCSNETLHEMFEKQVSHNPNGMCLTFGNKVLSYKELNTRANQLAHTLIDLGVNKGDRVGLGLQRSFELYISMIAILKAGACFVPLGLDLPEERLKYMVNDSEIKLVVCKQKDKEKYAKLTTCFSDFNFSSAIHSKNPKLEIDSENSCYIMYTSGSTGRPKGVVNYHKGLVNHFEFLSSIIDLDQNDKTLQKTPLSFDASLLEIFLPLCTGASIHITKAGKEKDLKAIYIEIVESNSSFLCLTPSYLSLLMEIMPEPIHKIKYLLVGGENFAVSIHNLSKKLFPEARIFNLYGPCEASIDSLIYEVKSTSKPITSIPIGKPIKNMQAFVLNEKLQIVPNDVEGELVISGLGVGGPYVGLKNESSKKFIANPFDPESQYHAYKTGDRVKKLVDGNFIFLGRLDHQIKILGMRIEIEEIEAAILEIDGISQAAVVQKAGKNNTSSNTLYAHYSCSEKKIDVKTIRMQLLKVLPRSMIPGAYVEHQKIPLTPGGKIDRSALKKYAPQANQNLDIHNNSWSANPKNEIVNALWEETLSSPINYGSDFFGLGGNSITAISLMNSINLAFKEKFELQLIYKYPIYADFISEINNRFKNDT